MSDPERLTLAGLTDLVHHGKRIAMVTAYDASSAALADEAGLDIILVGDSAAMTIFGHESTLPVTMDEMLMLTRAVTRGVRQSVRRRGHAIRRVPNGRRRSAPKCHSIREGRRRRRREARGRRADAHEDQRDSRRRHSGDGTRRADAADRPASRVVTRRGDGRLLRHDAFLMRRARSNGRAALRSCSKRFRRAVAARITDALKIPTIGIGAGASCDGQVLVWHDLLGLTRGHVPRFVKRYGDLSQTTLDALQRYAADVRNADLSGRITHLRDARRRARALSKRRSAIRERSRSLRSRYGSPDRDPLRPRELCYPNCARFIVLSFPFSCERRFSFLFHPSGVATRIWFARFKESR